MFLGKKRTYLDAAAGATGNPSSPHAEGRAAKKMLEDARKDVARLLEVQADDVIFMSGATESNALAILGVVRAVGRRAQFSGSFGHGPQSLRKLRSAPAHVLYLPSAHASIVENIKLLAEEGVSSEPLPMKNFRVDTNALAKIIRPETVLVSMEAVCGETGVVWNTREVAGVLAVYEGLTKSQISGHGASGLRKSGILLHVDASQAPLTEKITRAHFGADMLTLDGSKVGVRGIGALVAHRTIPLAPLYKGGGQERGLRPGSETPELAERFAEALLAAAWNRAAFRARAERDRAALIARIIAAIPNLHINEGRGVGGQAPNILNLSLPGRDTDYLVALLDEAGFAVSTRSACETDSPAGSRAVLALFGDEERTRTTLRISWNASVRSRDLARFAQALARAVGFIDSAGSG